MEGREGGRKGKRKGKEGRKGGRKKGQAAALERYGPHKQYTAGEVRALGSQFAKDAGTKCIFLLYSSFYKDHPHWILGFHI